MNSFKKIAFCYVAPLLSILSVSTAPLEVEAQSCNNSSCCIDWCSLLVPVLGGAAAGAAVGAIVNNNSKHGKRGCKGPTGETGATGAVGPQGFTGPEGDNPFVRDIENSLTFTFIIESITIGDNAVRLQDVEGPIIPYVGTPEGEVLVGTPIPFTNLTNFTVSITKGSPVYGNYMFGIQVPAHDFTATIDFRIEVDVGDGRFDTIYPGDSSEFTVTLPPTAVHQAVQLPSTYTFGPIGTVPSGQPFN
jgi:hypothetical protein